MDPLAAQVLAFWFGEPGSPERGRSRREWFAKDADLDAQIRRRFLALHASAALGECDRWAGEPPGLLALIVVLDQFSRNLYRDDPRAFAQDERALSAARLMVERRWDESLLPVERLFAYLPFEHAEDLAEQDRCVALMGALEAFEETRGMVTWAEKHRVIVRRFGRFPHRNEALGRESTPEETAFLQEPGSRF